MAQAGKALRERLEIAFRTFQGGEGDRRDARLVWKRARDDAQALYQEELRASRPADQRRRGLCPGCNRLVDLDGRKQLPVVGGEVRQIWITGIHRDQRGRRCPGSLRLVEPEPTR